MTELPPLGPPQRITRENQQMLANRKMEVQIAQAVTPPVNSKRDWMPEIIELKKDQPIDYALEMIKGIHYRSQRIESALKNGQMGERANDYGRELESLKVEEDRYRYILLPELITHKVQKVNRLATGETAGSFEVTRTDIAAIAAQMMEETKRKVRDGLAADQAVEKSKAAAVPGNPGPAHDGQQSTPQPKEPEISNGAPQIEVPKGIPGAVPRGSERTRV